MRRDDIQQSELFSYGSLDDRVPASHPLRPIRAMVDEALKPMSTRFGQIYGDEGRRSIPPERLLRALLLQMLYSVRSEADADGRTRIQPVVPLDRRAWLH